MKVDDARIHGDGLGLSSTRSWRPELDSWWQKVAVMPLLMVHHPDVEWFFWVDSDAVFTGGARAGAPRSRARPLLPLPGPCSPCQAHAPPARPMLPLPGPCSRCQAHAPPARPMTPCQAHPPPARPLLPSEGNRSLLLCDLCISDIDFEYPMDALSRVPPCHLWHKPDWCTMHKTWYAATDVHRPLPSVSSSFCSF